MGGMAQPLETWEPMARALSKTRNVLLLEPLGIGRSSSSSISYSLADQASAVCDKLPSNGPMDFVGFSLGARILLTVALLPTTQQSIRKIHLTGISVQRSRMAQVAMKHWIELLLCENWQSFGWSLLQMTFSSHYLSNQPPGKIQQWIHQLEQGNIASELLQVLQETPMDGILLPTTSTTTITNTGTISIPRGTLLVGEKDGMAPPEYASILAQQCGWDNPTILPNVGHALPFECPREWRNHVLTYLDAP